MHRWAWFLLFGLVWTACDKGGGDDEGGGGGEGASGYGPAFTAAMLPDGFAAVRMWESTLADVQSAFPEATYRVMRVEQGPIYGGPMLSVNANDGGASLPVGARNVSFHFQDHEGVQRLMRIDVAQTPDNATPVCDWLVSTIGPMAGAEDACIDEHIFRGQRDTGAHYCVGSPDGSKLVDMECTRAAAGTEHTMMVRIPNR